MAIKYFDTTTNTWKDYNGEITNATKGSVYINGEWKPAWRGINSSSQNKEDNQWPTDT